MLLELTSFICAQSWGLRRSTVVEIPTTGAGASHSPRHHSFVAMRSLVELLCLQVQGCALLDCREPLDLQGGTGLLDGNDPRVVLLGSAGLLAHNLAILLVRSFACKPPMVFAFPC